jgi:mannose-6-phosphate isomerase-like protein (cupin superfamily)
VSPCRTPAVHQQAGFHDPEPSRRAKNLFGKIPRAGHFGVVRRCRIRRMNVGHTKSVRKFFKVLQTSTRSQVAMMTLKPGEASGPKGNDHPKSEQVVYVIEGELVAEIRGETRTLKAGDCVTVPLRASHRFVNRGNRPAVTFNVYAPPAYAEDEEADGPEGE